MACTTTIPPVVTSECSPVRNVGGIASVYIARADRPDFTDWTLVGEWTTDLDDTGVTGSEIRTLYVRGSLPAATINEIPVSRGQTFYGTPVRTLNINIDDLSDENYTFLTAADVGLPVKFWFKDNAGYLYGGNSGISATLRSSLIIDEDDETSIQLDQSVLTWKATNRPERAVSPI